MPERDCATCKQQERWGCDAVKYIDPDTGKEEWYKKAAMPMRLGDEEIWSCPRRPIKDDPAGFNRLMTYYHHYRGGFLPDEGGVADQSARALELLQIVAVTNRNCDDELAERERQKKARLGNKQGRR